jgi:hypothetical protein
MNTTIKDRFVKGGVIVLLIAILGAGGYWLLWDKFFPPPIEPYSVVIVLSPGSNSRTINFDDNPELLERINRVVNSYGFAAIVIADGQPANETRVYDFSVFRPDRIDGVINDKVISENVTSLRQLFFEELRNARNQVAERDLIESISLASRILSSRPDDEIREIVVLSTGLSTAGFLNFADENRWLVSDATAIIEILQSNKSLPNLDGITVSWFQMHDVCGVTQDIIPGHLRSNLEEIWRLVVTNSGGEFNLVNAHPGTGIYEGLPTVRPVEIPSAILALL